MKTWILITLVLSMYGQVNVSENFSHLEELMRKDSVYNPERDVFIILTPDTVSRRNGDEEGIFYLERLPRQKNEITGCYDTIRCLDYMLESSARGIADLLLVYDEYFDKKLVLPKTFLQKVKLLDMNKKFVQFKDFRDAYNFLCDTLLYGENLKRVREYVPEDASYLDIKKARDKIGPYMKRIWLSDTRYITTDSLTLLQVRPVKSSGGFSPKKKHAKRDGEWLLGFY